MKINCGIYTIINTIDNMVYIGSSSNLKSRKWNHFNKLNRNEHSNKHLQNTYNKLKKLYGKENIKDYFKWNTIKEVEKIEDKVLLKEELLKCEQHYLNEYIINGKIDNSKCYNFNPVAGSNLGVKYSEEYRLNCSKRLKGIYPLKHLSKKEIIEVYEKISNSNMGHNPTKETKNKMSESFKKRTDFKEHINKMARINSIPVINLDTMKKFISIREAELFYGLMKSSGIGAVCRGKRKSAGGYRWQFI